MKKIPSMAKAFHCTASMADKESMIERQDFACFSNDSMPQSCSSSDSVAVNRLIGCSDLRLAAAS